MTTIERSIEINAPSEKIWPLMQWDRTPGWYAPWTKVEWTSKERNKVGSTVHINVELDVKTELDCETTEIIENKIVAFRSIGKNPTTGFHSLTPTNNGTIVTLGATYKLPFSSR